MDGVNGATVLPSRSIHAGTPVANGFSAVGVSSSLVHKSPRSRPVGAAPADGAIKQKATVARSSVRARRDTANLLRYSVPRHSHTASRARLLWVSNPTCRLLRSVPAMEGIDPGCATSTSSATERTTVCGHRRTASWSGFAPGSCSPGPCRPRPPRSLTSVARRASTRDGWPGYSVVVVDLIEEHVTAAKALERVGRGR